MPVEIDSGGAEQQTEQSNIFYTLSAICASAANTIGGIPVLGPPVADIFTQMSGGFNDLGGTADAFAAAYRSVVAAIDEARSADFVAALLGSIHPELPAFLADPIGWTFLHAVQFGEELGGTIAGLALSLIDTWTFDPASVTAWHAFFLRCWQAIQPLVLPDLSEIINSWNEGVGWFNDRVAQFVNYAPASWWENQGIHFLSALGFDISWERGFAEQALEWAFGWVADNITKVVDVIRNVGRKLILALLDMEL